MRATTATDPLRGKTIRLSWTEGPTKGKTHEHVFHDDGTVEWHAVDEGRVSQPADKGGAKPEVDRPRYAGFALDDKVSMLSYLSKSGYTLTVALRHDDGTAVGVASNDSSWYPVKGTFEIVR